MTDPALPIAVELIAEFEGFRSEPYQDSAGVFTIGYGTTVTEDGKHVTADTPPVTQEAAYARLQSMTATVLAKVRGMVLVPITDHMAAALTSFAYNIGPHALYTSTLLNQLNTGHPESAVQQFGAWIYAGGVRSQGLVNRRAKEAAVFVTVDTPSDVVDGMSTNMAVLAPQDASDPQKSAENRRSTAVDVTDALNAAELTALNPEPAEPAPLHKGI